MSNIRRVLMDRPDKFVEGDQMQPPATEEEQVEGLGPFREINKVFGGLFQ